MNAIQATSSIPGDERTSRQIRTFGRGGGSQITTAAFAAE
jgi:hypothetical protein